MDNKRKREYNKKWQLENKDKVATYYKKFWDKKKNEVNEKRREQYALDPEKYRKKTRKWQKANPEKKKAIMDKWRKANPDYRKKFKEKYPEKFEARVFKSLMWRIDVEMTYDEFKKMLIKQDNKCAICGNEETKRRMSVDHCHKTGKVRGLLCQLCNTSLGGFQDDVNRLKKAIKYLSTK